MFTGIITDVGVIDSVRKSKTGEKEFRIRTKFNMAAVKLGASIACSGICLTVTNKGKNWFEAMASKETLKLTNADKWKKGDRINLEQSLKIGDELGGHIVTGHVDGLAKIIKLEKAGKSVHLTLETTKELSRFIAKKGSVCLDGISLTVNEAKKKSFAINIIPHTMKHTSLQFKKTGDLLNIEVDIFARYLQRFTEVK